ncbi:MULTISPECIES: DUF2339 domain-containing protein [Chryseobacterium]|uniref:Membrane protein n=1 Tax=Chryseobacterium camelliae TaxID=1265445 RepID=A0ABU0TF78_9FLAO|nr:MULTISPECIES: DUF2339 domain-containing protein [Chryseobacterium]MDT3406545.1 putative membrane protein [Pseudacidovorax intermedius]MDQ1095657.1 putative membrane protein [Chryseobacterium camelliae]MDQ1099594.1 putative membrane protein [Chryseobacterium sp. SORGH_AS_1048]MDR6086942.1 putative membrane protein [Chryseobacterium sp. SORGH_AS_0909]MDR6131314.1 putative membrane protein [Chryseobacterium sp. SORGH_AS_1175]
MNYIFFIILIVILFILYRMNQKINRLDNEIRKIKNQSAGAPINSEPLPGMPEKPTAQKALQESPKAQPVMPDDDNDQFKDRTSWLSQLSEFFAQNALTVIGIFTLVLGIGYFIKYAIDNNWIGETARISIGFIAGLVIIGIGYPLRKNYPIFSSVITGGGISVLYFTVTIAFRDYHFFSQQAAFSITCLITLLSIAFSYAYKSETLSVFSLLGGFAAPLMISTGQSNYLFLFSYITILNIGMLIIVLLRNWSHAGWISFILTYCYLFYWTASKTETDSIYFYILSYFVFYAYGLQGYLKGRKLCATDILMLVFLNFFSITGLVYTFNKLHLEPVVIFPLIFALCNLLLALREHKAKRSGISYSVFTALSISLITVAAALQLNTHLITSVWAIEATLLLFILKKSGHTVFRNAFYILFPLVLIAQTATWAQYFEKQNLPVIFNPVFFTSCVTILSTAINLFMIRKKTATEEAAYSLPEIILSAALYCLIYATLLFELLYHTSTQPLTVINSIAAIYTVYYIFILLLCSKIFKINSFTQTLLKYLLLILCIEHTSVNGSFLVDNILHHTLPGSFYFLYALYLIPFTYTLWSFLSKKRADRTRFDYRISSFALVVIISLEIGHLYILGNTESWFQKDILQKHYIILYLPIIWMLLASAFIYTGIKRDWIELRKIGFFLTGITIVKLYIYDVWQMDHVSRIIAFIILGIILLFSSFIFQRLKIIISTLIKDKEKEEIRNNKEIQ